MPNRPKRTPEERAEVGRGIRKRIEAIGLLNDAFEKLVADPHRTDAMLEELARKHEDRHLYQRAALLREMMLEKEKKTQKRPIRNLKKSEEISLQKPPSFG